VDLDKLIGLLTDDDDLDDLEDKEFDALIAVSLDKAAAEHESTCDDPDCEGVGRYEGE
jgi:hypothetical protein